MIKLSKVFLQRGWVQIKVLGSGITIKACNGVTEKSDIMCKNTFYS